MTELTLSVRLAAALATICSVSCELTDKPTDPVASLIFLMEREEAASSAASETALWSPDDAAAIELATVELRVAPTLADADPAVLVLADASRAAPSDALDPLGVPATVLVAETRVSSCCVLSDEAVSELRLA